MYVLPESKQRPLQLHRLDCKHPEGDARKFRRAMEDETDNLRVSEQCRVHDEQGSR